MNNIFILTAIYFFGMIAFWGFQVHTASYLFATFFYVMIMFSFMANREKRDALVSQEVVGGKDE